jgi:hypothetical protein
METKITSDISLKVLVLALPLVDKAPRQHLTMSWNSFENCKGINKGSNGKIISL